MRTSKNKRDNGEYCCCYGCVNVPVKAKLGMCHKHYARHRKEIDPVYDRYVNFKGNALRRGKEFTITLIQFRSFCHCTGYILTKGKRGRNATVDRIDNNFGYHIWNIQLLTAHQNTRKYYDHDRYNLDITEDLPF